MSAFLRIDPKDNLIVALRDLPAGERINVDGEEIVLPGPVGAKHKFVIRPVPEGGLVTLYGLPVGQTLRPLQRGEAVCTENTRHYAAPVSSSDGGPYAWRAPDVGRWAGQTFAGVIRPDGRVGTANHWLILPLVFCENRDSLALGAALGRALGYSKDSLENYARSLTGGDPNATAVRHVFPHVDGVRAIAVNSGCGGTADDARALCRILAAYADHPNVAGVTLFGLGCEKAQPSLFEAALAERNPAFAKPLRLFRRQGWSSESAMMREAARWTVEGLAGADRVRRAPVPLSHLKLGVKCGGSDGFSGISANPVIGLVSDCVVALGGASVMGEFPELCGAEGVMAARCNNPGDREKFFALMRRYEEEANRCGTSMADNPSPGNIRDGLITDAIKSLGAAKKGGTAPVAAVLDYGEAMPDSGFSLACTPGNDLEAVTGLVAAGANLVLFSTGLGTPTGNPIVPVLKIAGNTPMAERLADIIDFDCGPVIQGSSLETMAAALLDKVAAAAGRECVAKAEALEQHDFLFWKRKVSL